MDKVKIEIQLKKSEIMKLEELTDTELIDDDGYYSDDEISDAISILLEIYKEK